MAGIDRVCEFSGESPNCPIYGGSWIMKRWKRNHIQIMPQYRKRFRGATARLRIVETEVNLWHKGRTSYESPCVWTAVEHDESAAEYVWNEQQKGNCLRIQYLYVLEVDDPELQGEVGGRYKEWSHDISAVIRRLRRLTGPHLEVIREVPDRSTIMRNWRRQFEADCAAHRERELERERMRAV